MKPAWLHSFAPRHQPVMTRPSYACEMVSAMSFPIALATVEGGVIGILAEKVFNVSPLGFATILAAPMFANLTSFLWAMLAKGKPKIPFINGIQIAALLGVATIGILPTEGLGPAMLVLTVILVRCMAAGIVTLRSVVWRMNYPRQLRARITGRLVFIVSIVLAVSPLLTYALLDIEPGAFRYVYPGAAMLGIVGVIAFSRIRVRGEKQLLNFEKVTKQPPQPHGAPGSVYEYDPQQAGQNSYSFWSVLKQDKLFRHYMIWQFVAGLANLAGEAAFIRYIATRTDGMSMEFTISIVLTTVLPMGFAAVTLPLWAGYLDRVHIAEFRTRHGILWMLAQGATWLAALTGILFLLAIPRILQGLARSGGMLAWNLGHNDFADRNMAALYMGIHVTLTGVRGLIAPYLGVMLLEGYGGFTIPGLASIPGFDGIGIHVFALAALGTAIAYGGFVHLHILMKRQQINKH